MTWILRVYHPKSEMLKLNTPFGKTPCRRKGLSSGGAIFDFLIDDLGVGPTPGETYIDAVAAKVGEPAIAWRAPKFDPKAQI